MMKKRLLFVIVYVLCMPLTFLAIIMVFLGMIIAPVAWIITGDEDKAWNCVYGGVQSWFINLPWKITGQDDY